jgi:hypothetical protein
MANIMHSLPNLSPAVSREAYASLCGLLPPRDDDTPQVRAQRLEAAMEAVAALHPGDAFEAELATQIVGASAHAKECLRQASHYRNDLAASLKCRAQAASMMRQMQSGLRILQRMQAGRDKALAEMHPAAMQRAGYWFHAPAIRINRLRGRKGPGPKLGLEGGNCVGAASHWLSGARRWRRGDCGNAHTKPESGRLGIVPRRFRQFPEADVAGASM